LDSVTPNNEKEAVKAELANHPAAGPDHQGKTGWFYVFPLLLSILIITGITPVGQAKGLGSFKVAGDSETGLKSKHKHEINFAALLANEQFSKNLRDTVYTDKDLWLELRIDRQTLYVHYRDGRVIEYPVSTGIPGASKSVESRPGIFAIFLKEEVHLSSQFNNARMNYYMPYNMGIGFHGLPGTGYYGHLGVRPSSHGCIRMRNDHVRSLFGQCDIGTLVLSHKGYSARTIAFAPEGFQNEMEYSKDDCMKITAYNLGTLMEGKYFLNPPKRIILDGTLLPKSGITVASSHLLPDRQMLPFTVAEPEVISDRIESIETSKNLISKGDESIFTVNILIEEPNEITPDITQLDVNPEKVKKYAHNPLGILPYFPPDR